MIETLRSIIQPVLFLADTGIKRIDRIHVQEGDSMTKKQLSECISGVIETKIVAVCQDRGISAQAPKKDSEPDIILDGVPLEIKTTSSAQWRGGAFSKREADYLFIKWGIDEYGDFSWFALHKYLTEEAWRNGNVNNYYATSISLSDMLDGTILFGSTQKKRVLEHPVLEKITWHYTFYVVHYDINVKECYENFNCQYWSERRFQS